MAPFPSQYDRADIYTELGRFWVLQSSLFLVNVFQFGVGFAQNLDPVIACRTLGGLSTAGGVSPAPFAIEFYEPAS